MGSRTPFPIQASLLAAVTALFTFLIVELTTTRPLVSQLCLALALLSTGTALYQLNQQQSENTQLARFATTEELPIALRCRVTVPPDTSSDNHGNLYWTADATELLTTQGWLSVTGTSQIKWRANPLAPTLHRNDTVELYGWLSLPPNSPNPGTLNPRQQFAADRIFTQIRVPRSDGIIILDNTAETSTNYLTKTRTYLRGKLLEHTARLDPDAANTMVALLLGTRDPSIDDISRSFADAGVAHLLAISGSHIVILAACIWFLANFIPMRPRIREPLVALFLIGYVLVTPCGPPIIRTGIAVIMVLIARMIGRPRAYLNMVAAAAMIVALWRPTEIFSPGFQLTFICTAALILLAQRLYDGLFHSTLERTILIANLSQTWWDRAKANWLKIILVLFCANIIGVVSSTPISMYQFQRLNPLAILTGLIALPAIAITMFISLLQLLAGLLSSPLAVAFAPISTKVTHLTLILIQHLSRIPGTAISLRKPPSYIVAILFVPIFVWIIRHRLNMSRAMIVNASLASILLTVFWYSATLPLNALHLQILSVGQGSAILLTTPNDRTFLINAGSRDQPDITSSAIAPAVKSAGLRRLDGILLTTMDTVHARNAGEIVTRFSPTTILAPNPDPQHWTLAAAELEDAVRSTHLFPQSLHAGDQLQLARNCTAEILWPPENSTTSPNLVLMLTYANHRLLLLDPTNLPALSLLQMNHINLQCDTILLLGPERGDADQPLRNLLATTNATKYIWTGRTAWAPHTESPSNYNTINGYIDLNIHSDGTLTLHQ